MVARQAHNLEVARSSRTPATKETKSLVKLNGAQQSGCSTVGSILGLGPRGRTFESCHPDQHKKLRAFSSAGSEHLPYKQRVGGSNPSTPTEKERLLSFLFSYIYLYKTQRLCRNHVLHPPSKELVVTRKHQIRFADSNRKRINTHRPHSADTKNGQHKCRPFMINNTRQSLAISNISCKKNTRISLAAVPVPSKHSPTLPQPHQSAFSHLHAW